MLKNIRFDKKAFLKALSMQIQIFCFIGVSVLVAYLFINFNKFNITLPGAESEEIKEYADSTVVQELNFSDNIPEIKPNEYKSAVETTDRSNYLKIDRILIDGSIIDGPAENQDSLLRQGFWRYPDTKKPYEDGTATIFGHRRAKLPPSKETFYNLDKVKLGDLIEVGYEGKKYFYKVIKTLVVEPTDWNAIKDESFKSIKLITCTPLGTSNQRLVITAEQI